MSGAIRIRAIRPEDAEAYLELQRAADAQSEYLLFEAGERPATVPETRQRIEKLLASGNSMIFLAEADEGSLVGYLNATGGEARRSRHSAYIVIAILDGYRGMGVGTKLFTALEDWARSLGLRRLSLGLMAENETARALYVKMGFLEEGRKKEAFLLPGRYVDELLMYKLLDTTRE